MELFARARFIDLFFLVLCLRVIYIALKRGVVPEVFKLTGVILGSFLAFHFYSSFGNMIGLKVLFINKNYLNFIYFLVIILGTGLFFSLLRAIILFLVRKEEVSFTERRVSFLLGVIRAVFLSSIVIFLLHLSPFKVRSLCPLSYGLFKNIATTSYFLMFKIYNKFYSEAVLNKEVMIYHEVK